jgi:hypothetical protein
MLFPKNTWLLTPTNFISKFNHYFGFGALDFIPQ